MIALADGTVILGGGDVLELAQRSVDSAVSFEGDKGMTKQSFKDETDINVIVKRFGIGVSPVPEGTYAWTNNDFTGVTDFRSALELVVLAEDSFMTLPANVRAEFDNDPGKFVAFASDQKNVERLVQLGLATKREEAKPMKVEVVTTPVVADGTKAAMKPA